MRQRSVSVQEISLDLSRKIYIRGYRCLININITEEVFVIKSDKPEKHGNARWVIIITIVTFFVSMILSYLAADISQSLSWYFAVIVLFFMIFTGIVFDIIGIAITTADETPFHALASKKERGAKQAIKLLRNAEKMSNFCNDVIGDIAGIISGSTSAAIVVYLVKVIQFSNNDMIISVVLTAITAALTVGGKAVGKSIAIKNANKIVLGFSKVICFFTRKK